MTGGAVCGKAKRKPVICLAGSGGGHVRQLLDLKPFWQDRNCVFVTEDTALGRSLGVSHPVRFLPHFALGQMRLRQGLRMVRAAASSLLRSLSIIREFRPDLVVTAGAGSMIFIVAWARLLGARIVLVDSFARFEKPSAFARLGTPLAHHVVTQSEVSARFLKGATAIDPLRYLPTRELQKEDHVFATVGATLGFPRLVNMIAEAKDAGLICEQVTLQVGKTAVPANIPPGIDIVRNKSFQDITDLCERSSTVICHGGTGSILTALRAQCHTIVVPRLAEQGEHYDDHQLEIAKVFERRGLVQVAQDQASLEAALAARSGRKVEPVTTDYTQLTELLEQILAECVQNR